MLPTFTNIARYGVHARGHRRITTNAYDGHNDTQVCTNGVNDDDFSVIVTVCRGPGALGIYSTHGTPSFMHHYGY